MAFYGKSIYLRNLVASKLILVIRQITGFPDDFKGVIKLFILIPQVANLTAGYMLDKYFSEPSESCLKFYISGKLGLIFFVEFE